MTHRTWPSVWAALHNNAFAKPLSVLAPILSGALLIGLLFSTQDAHAQDSLSSIEEEGRVRHNESGRLYHFRIYADSTIHIRQANASSEESLGIPLTTMNWLHKRINAQIRSVKQDEYFSFSYEDESLVLHFAKRFNVYVLISLIVIVVVGGVILLRLRRRLAQERRRREALAQSQRYLTKGREKERARLAQEIHDGPVQDLHGLHMKINAFPEPPDPDTISDELMRVTSELRAMSADLHPPALQRFGLPAALRSHADRLSDRHPDTHFRLELPDECPSMPDAYALSLFRIAQEAMNNAVQHGNASQVTLHLDCTDGTTAMTIEDDGTGFSVPDDWNALAEEEHYGLIGMRERADAINADLDIASDPEAGTRIRLYGEIKAFDTTEPLPASPSSVPA